MNAQAASNYMPGIALLAGGMATRLRPITTTVPKSMVPVADRPFIAHQIEGLVSQGITEIVICSGYLGEQIQEFLGDGSRFGCRVQYSFDGAKLLGTGGALRKALPLLGEQFVIMYGDSYLKAPIRPIWNEFCRSGKPALMTVFRNEDKWDKSNIEFRNGSIVNYDKVTPTATMEHIDYGLGCMRAEVLEAWPAEATFDLASVYQHLVEQQQLAGYEVRDRFYEIGSPAGLAETDALLRQVSEAKATPNFKN
jgi:N-acetyl-alpha-D-muramate 1-phosphate uridylyltransferase